MRSRGGTLARVVLLGLVAAVAGATLAGPRRGAGGSPSSPRPADLDLGFRAALPALVARLAEEEGVGVLAPAARSSMSSWYWTMAAFDVPRLRWSRVRQGGEYAGRWLVAPSGVDPWDGWRVAWCREGWCLWAR